MSKSKATKYYVQNGYNKLVCVDINCRHAAVRLLNDLLKPNPISGDELAELSPLVTVSQCGFMDDVEKGGMVKEFDEIRMFRTSKLLDSMRRRDIGDFMRQKEKTLPEDNLRLIRSL